MTINHLIYSLSIDKMCIRRYVVATLVVVCQLTTNQLLTPLSVVLHMIMASGQGVPCFVRRVATISNGKFLQLLLNVLSIATATNNIEFPSAGVTKSYNNKQRVLLDGGFMDLQDATTHNVKCFVKYYAGK